MTILSTTSRNDYVGNGSTDTYDYAFKIFEDADLLVTQATDAGVESTLTLNTDYTVSGAGDASGGSITLTAGNLTADYTLSIRRVVDITQPTDIRNQGEFFPETHEDVFDRMVMIDQQQQDEIDRSVRLPENISPDDFDISLPTDIADHPGSTVIVNSLGNGFTLGIDSNGTDASKVSKSGDHMTGDLYMDAQHSVIFRDASNVGSIRLKGGSSIAGDQTYTLPVFPTSTKYLKATTSGVMGFDSADDISFAGTIASGDVDLLQNLGLQSTVSASALTISIMDALGAALLATNVARIAFRTTVATDGRSVLRSMSSGVTLTIPSSATLGSQNAIPDYLYIWALDNAGTVELGVSGAGFIPVDGIASSTAMSAAATSSSVLYSTSARSGVAVRLLGRLLYTQNTAGSWLSAGTTLELSGVGKNLHYEIGSFTANFNQVAGSGVGAANTSKTIKFSRIGNIVTLDFPDSSDMTCGTTGSNFSTTTSVIPTRLTPSQSRNTNAIAKINNTVSASAGRLVVVQDGSIAFFRALDASTNFTSTQTNNGFLGLSMTYSLQ